MSDIIPTGSLEPREPLQSLEVENEQIDNSQLHNALVKDISGVYLGRLGAGSFRDTSETPVIEAGFSFGVEQNSCGYTGIYASPLEGFVVQSLNPDASSRKTMWHGPEEWQENANVHVNSDWGKDLNVPIEQWAHTNFGNPGTRSGIIRVRDPEGNVKHYLMGADFKGQPDGWRVSGRIVEVEPHPSLVLPPVSRPALLAVDTEAVAADPTLAVANLPNRLMLGGQVIGDLSTAFERITPYIRTLYAPDHIARQAKEFAEISQALLLELASSRPELLDGHEAEIDGLGRIVRSINKTNGSNAGFVTSIDDEDEARIEYLTNVGEIVNRYGSNADNAQDFSRFTRQALDILAASLDTSQAMTIDAKSDLAQKIDDIITKDKERTAEIKAEREDALMDTVFDPDWKPAGIEQRLAVAGQVITIDLNDPKPLLDGEQTYHAFYSRSRYQGGEKSFEGFEGPTLFILEIDGNKYALVDNREAISKRYSGRNSKIGDTDTRDTRFDKPFKLLQIVDENVDPRLGMRVSADDLDFDHYQDGNIERVRNLADRNERGYLNGTADSGVRLELDKNGVLTIDGYNKKVGITAPAGVVKFQPQSLPVLFAQSEADLQKIEELRKADAKHRQEVVRWQEWADNIRAAQAEGREGLSGSRGYNLSSDPKYYRAQGYVATLDEEGNIWGDFRPGRDEIGITGKPLAPGRHLMMRNPTLNK